jgi:hypothetical protein
MIEARSISSQGLLSKWPDSDLRSYGFPLFLAGALKAAQWLHVGPSTGVFLTQWPLFVGSAWLASTSLFSSQRARLIAFTAVGANPLLVVYAAQAFTESLTLSCILFATAALGRAARRDLRPSAAAWLMAGAAASSYALALRPGSVLVPLCYALAAAGVLLYTGQGKRWVTITATAALAFVALVTPLIPQVLINHRHYNSLSPLPTYDLANAQAKAGLTYSRYITNVSDCGEPGIGFPNPNPPTVPEDVTTLDALRYYTLTWPHGPEAMVLHVFSGFDPRPFLIDQRDFGAPYERALQAFTLALFFLAGAGATRARMLVLEPRGRIIEPRRIRLDVAFLGVVTVIFLGILATVETEYRFGAVPLLTVSLLAAYGAAQRWRPSKQVVATLAVGYVGALLLWLTLSDLLLATSPTWQQCS